VEAFAFRAMVAYSSNYCAAFVAAVVVAVVDAVVVAAAGAYDAAAFPQVVDEVNAMVHVRKIDSHRAFPRKKLADYQPVIVVAFRTEALHPFADFLDDIEGESSLVVHDAAAFDEVVREAPMRGDARAVAVQLQGYRSAVHPDHQKEEPSS